ncbi:PspA/IM30 family protein [Buttiauxella agrestis]|uniref:PspA/IM30 family protein n=1 Tax=Buttiauxella agrestis ATCC 33320 TaxID=1006004 RepID=A0A085GKT2_9ENTR|nr:PspA/IM30 family protein [Buttiauxella agrestis]KFC84327.1 PspA/IM30 family protein [Buttiauxella agrestis ATCC 33320]
MGILKKLFTIGKSVVADVEDNLEESQGIRLLEQHIRDARNELDKAGKSRVDLLARVRMSKAKLAGLHERQATLELSAVQAMEKQADEALLQEVAEEIARLDDAISTEEKLLKNLESSQQAVEQAVKATGSRIAQFEQQLEMIKATEATQRAQQAVTASSLGATTNVATAAESLKRIKARQAERQAKLDAIDELEKVNSGTSLDEKLAEAGIGNNNRTSADDVLARLRKKSRS